MVLNLFRPILLLLALLFAMPAAAPAHENHSDAQAAPSHDGQMVGALADAAGERMNAHAAAAKPQPRRSFGERLMRWLGRIHPFAVHFPVALFPAALAARVLLRRRDGTVECIRALIIAAGAASLVAGLLGWLTAGFTLDDPDQIHRWHRALGTMLAFAGIAVTVWAWLWREAVASRTMLLVLSLVTFTLFVQGWLGAVLVRGTNHMAF
ncbi:DUF2231 domain-containing protein [Sphingomonas sp.]|uniref:DUF2231 domain-containing protein n=1 Tax=Sphingomonas sp. TaxID=28214 RepID=UPI002EDA24EF